MSLNTYTSPLDTKRVDQPSGYKGLYAFHKYWGKKPHESIAYAISLLSEPGQIVADPFVGSGTTGREAILQSRRFIGIDINPVAVELTRLLVSPPVLKDLQLAAGKIEKQARNEILESYAIEGFNGFASHYLWEQDILSKVWRLSGRHRVELKPTRYDYTLSESYSGYNSVHIRTPQFFSNSRISTVPSMGIGDILTGRAQRNIDILIDAIRNCEPSIQPALMLCLTAASGQMSKMVFAVTSRGKTTGKVSQKVEVGSWVIGYWRPALHFEINVWNCFQHRLSKLQKAISLESPLPQIDIPCNPIDVISREAEVCVSLDDSRKILNTLPSSSLDLVIADPPHGDRIPYLELSEFWNSILGLSVNFDGEIVVSNAQERGKTSDTYVDSIGDFYEQVPRVLTPDGYFVLIFNARQTKWWSTFHRLASHPGGGGNAPLLYLGYFPCIYSAGSVVQDNRQGSLNTDYAMVFGQSTGNHAGKLRELATIPGWSRNFPEKLNEVELHGFQ